MASESYKHHYIPKCYLKRWAGEGNKLFVFEKNRDRLSMKRRHPSETGWGYELYSSDAFPEGEKDALEQRFMARVDQAASEVMDIFLSGGGDLTPDQRTGWSRFLMSLMHRHPDRVAAIKRQFAEEMERNPIEITPEHREEYARLRREGDPETVEAFLKSRRPRDSEAGGVKTIQVLCDSQLIGQHLNGMETTVVRVHRPKHSILTSDQPLIISGGLGNPNTFLLLPIGPMHFFLATNSHYTTRRVLSNVENGRVLLEINETVTRNAIRFVYSADAGHRLFVERRMRSFQR